MFSNFSNVSIHAFSSGSLSDGNRLHPARLFLVLQIARKHQKFSVRDDGFGYQWIDRENALDLMLWQVSESAAQLLSARDLTRIRQCGGDDCSWIFFGHEPQS